MFDSLNITDGADTTNIAVSSGGVTDENTTFLTPMVVCRMSVYTTLRLVAATEFVELNIQLLLLQVRLKELHTVSG